MTSALRGREGGWSKRDNSTDRLREWDSDKGIGGPKMWDVLYGWSLLPRSASARTRSTSTKARAAAERILNAATSSRMQLNGDSRT